MKSVRSPVLLAVDDDPGVLEDVETQLVQRYAHDYRVDVLAIPDGRSAGLSGARRDGEEVALVLAAESLSRRRWR